MSTVRKCVIDLSEDQVTFIDDQVASGRFTSTSDVVREGLRALQEREAPVGRWLRDVVGPTYDAMAAEPSRALQAKTVAAQIRAHHAATLKR